MPLRIARVQRLLGEEIPREDLVAILSRLGFEPAEDGDSLTATVPYWREVDVRREADLIEEVARIHGYDRLPTTLPARRRAVGRLTDDQRLRRRLEDVLRDRGLSETMSWSFTSRRALEALRVEEPGVAVANPLSEEQSVMRPLLLGGLLDAAARNAAFGRPDVGLFELARVYVRPSPELPPDGSPGGSQPAFEGNHLGALLTVASPGGWRGARRPADLYAAKALVEAVMAPVGLEWWAEPGARPFLHPGRAASVFAGGHEVGWLGELHPLVARAWELGDEPVAAFELDVGVLAYLAAGPAEYSDVTSFPAVLQDVAVVVDESVPAAEVEAAVRAAAGELLASVRPFDLYRGEQVGEGKKSLALRLEFRAPDRTLTDEDVAARWPEIEKALERIGGGCVAEQPNPVAVIGAAGFGGALCAMLVDRHPSLELAARHGAHRRGPAPRRAATRATACGMEHGGASTPTTWPSVAQARAGGLPPPGAPRPSVAAAARARPEGGGPVGGLPPGPGALRALVPAPRGAAPAGRGGLRAAGDQRHREEIAAADLVAGTRLQLHGRAAGPVAAARVPDRRGGGHQDRRVRRRARGHPGDPLRLRRRQRERLQDRGPPPLRRARPGAAVARWTSPSSHT
ncbi:MAG: phenylalanine--tRNA ligase subunit beta [Thermoleophilaceae bacterium]